MTDAEDDDVVSVPCLMHDADEDDHVGDGACRSCQRVGEGQAVRVD